MSNSNFFEMNLNSTPLAGTILFCHLSAVENEGLRFHIRALLSLLVFLYCHSFPKMRKITIYRLALSIVIYRDIYRIVTPVSYRQVLDITQP